MTSVPLAAEPSPATAVASATARARVVELLLVGGLTPFLFPLSWLLRRALGLDAAELGVGFLFFYGAFVVNDPHFSVTYLLFYRHPKRLLRGRWLLAGVVAPILLAAWAILALATRSAPALGWMIQLMFLLVGWHYVKQGFGVFVVLAARRGVRFSPRERLALLAHAYAGWAYAWANPYDPGREVEEKGVVYTTLAHPRGLEPLALAVLLATAAVLLVVLVNKARREGGFHAAIGTPLVAFLVSIWAWSIYASADPLVRYMIPALHSVQYLYFVWLMRSGEAREREAPPRFEPARTRLAVLALSALGLGWLLFHGMPSALDDLLTPRSSRLTDMGPTPYFAALYAFVNLHHYVMDSVVWRRDNPDTRYLTGS